MICWNSRVRLPKLFHLLYPKAVWNIRQAEKVVYLTFDDGPVPEVTPWVLDLLKQENIQATFFCVGENVQTYPEVFQQIVEAGHQTGNHTFNHLQGMKCSRDTYLANIEKADQLIGSKLFRPPHGLLKRSQYRQLKNRFRLIMWDVLSRDFDQKISPEQVCQNVLTYTRPGSVIIFHDSLKAEKNIKGALPRVIRELKNQGYQFDRIPVHQSI